LAVIAALIERAEVLWVGGEGGMEASLVAREGIPQTSIPAAGLHGVGLFSLPGNLYRLMRGYRSAKKVLNDFKPDVIFTTGGYVSVPVALANRTVPVVCYVPDIEPAMALRLVARRADLIAVTTEASKSYYARGRHVEVTGYPTRPSLHRVDRLQAKAQFGLEDGMPVLLVFGGSRGARSINEALWENLNQILFHAQVIHITGKLDWPRAEQVRDALADDLSERYKAFEYLHDEMGAALSAADLAVSRAGAATLGEYPLFSLPSILVPYPHAWKYQKTNAEYLVDHGAAIMAVDESLEDELSRIVIALLKDRGKLAEMRVSASKLHLAGAAERIAGRLEQLARTGGLRG
jgi:UDP-N-acetylglucosamine:LPS N-acetylglucosamine transferase